MEAEFAVSPPSIDPLARAGTRDAHFLGYVGDGSAAASLDEPMATFGRQRRILVGHCIGLSADARRAVSRLSTAWRTSVIAARIMSP